MHVSNYLEDPSGVMPWSSSWVFARWALNVDARALTRMQALEIEVTCV